MRSLVVYEDANGTHFTNIIAASDNVNFLSFASASVEKTITVPADASYAIFQSSNEFFVKIDATAAVPSGDITDGSGSIPIPLGLFVKAGQVLHIISSESGSRVGVMFFKRG